MICSLFLPSCTPAVESFMEIFKSINVVHCYVINNVFQWNIQLIHAHSALPILYASKHGVIKL